ncbi:ABC-type uncharacterized transport system ATPase component [Bartonella callosciuri]|uniref:ABC-type uncharacterized transport system ATPase component n=1 Tax=Bartonella callosciuri TaxID=686223 RepID=A0A840NQB2_9HYPH|nr:ABC-type uncharacterized transport system ATPase component [Bartonella callosciuri]
MALAALRGKRSDLRSALNHEKRQFFRNEIAQLGIGLEAYIHNPMDSLSGRQRQTVCLVMVTLAHADVFIT